MQTAGIKGGRAYLPYAFTEQGIYMLMSVLKGDLATSQSITLVRLFKSMKITQYSSSVIYEPLGTLVNDESVGKVIDKAIKDVYAEKDGYDEDQVRAKLIEMKKKITESEDLLFEKKYCQ